MKLSSTLAAAATTALMIGLVTPQVTQAAEPSGVIINLLCGGPHRQCQLISNGGVVGAPFTVPLGTFFVVTSYQFRFTTTSANPYTPCDGPSAAGLPGIDAMTLVCGSNVNNQTFGNATFGSSGLLYGPGSKPADGFGFAWMSGYLKVDPGALGFSQ